MAMATSPEKWVCGVCLYGITDLEIFYCNLPDYLKDWVKGQNWYARREPYSLQISFTACVMQRYSGSSSFHSWRERPQDNIEVGLASQRENGSE